MEREKKRRVSLEREKRDCMSGRVRNRNVRRCRGEARRVEYRMKKEQNASVKTMERKRKGKHKRRGGS